MGIAIVTGASSGIGKEFAKQMPRSFELDEIWVIARRSERLKELGKKIDGTKVVPIVADLTEKNDIKKIVDKLKKDKPTVLALINNAGIGYFNKFDKQDLELHKKTIETNITALTEMTYLVLPYMGKGGAIVQVASILAHLPMPGYATYSATKSYVMSFSEALRSELKESGIHVMTLCPGATDTEFFSGDNSSSSKRMSAQLLVERSIKALMKKKNVYYPSKKLVVASLFSRVLPRKATQKILEKKFDKMLSEKEENDSD